MESRSVRDWQRARNFFDQGQVAAAKAVCEGMLVRQAENPSAHWLLTSIALGQGHFRDAVRHAKAAAASAGKLPLMQATATTRNLISVGEYRTARDILFALDPRRDDGGPAFLAIAEQLIMLEQYAPALQKLDLAQRMGVRLPILGVLRSNALKFLGRFDEAADVLEATLAREPAYAHAQWSLANLGPLPGGERRVDRIRRAMTQAPPQSPGVENPTVSEHRAMLGYALFRELDAIGNTGAAWIALEDAMRQQRQLVIHDLAGEDALFDRLIDVYDANFLSDTAPVTDGHTPIFIVGMPRTGTTLLDRMIGNHQQVSNLGELNELQMQFKWATDHFSSDFLDIEGVNRMASIDAGALGRGYLKSTAWRLDGKPWATDKHQSNFVFSGLILKALPGAKIVYLTRDPVDSCFSNLKELFSFHMYTYSYDFAEVANHYRNYSRLMNHLDQAAPGRLLEVHYEDLVDDAPGVMKRVLAFCGLPPQPGVADVTANLGPVATASSRQVRESVHSRNVGSWRRYEAQLRPLQELLEQARR